MLMHQHSWRGFKLISVALRFLNKSNFFYGWHRYMCNNTQFYRPVPSSRNVHRLYPEGGFPQHRAMIFASISPVTTGGVCRTFRFNKLVHMGIMPTYNKKPRRKAGFTG
jgi:hypothetical protein